MNPPLPTFYNHQQTVDDLINHIVMRTLDQFGLHIDIANRWDGMMNTARVSRASSAQVLTNGLLSGQEREKR